MGAGIVIIARPRVSRDESTDAHDPEIRSTLVNSAWYPNMKGSGETRSTPREAFASAARRQVFRADMCLRLSQLHSPRPANIGHVKSNILDEGHIGIALG